MSDIVERLRAPAYWISGSSEGHEGDNSAPVEAARTIEILRAELAKVNMENDRLTRTNRAKREHRDKLLQTTAKQAAEIDRLRAAVENHGQVVKLSEELERLQAALRKIESNWEVPMEEKGWRALARFMWETARAALKETSDDR